MEENGGSNLDKGSEVLNSNIDGVQFSEVKSEVTSQSRERKRSKYLSYPYIDLNKQSVDLPVFEECATDDVAVSDSIKKLHTRRDRKPIYQPTLQIIPEDLDTPSINLLSKLCSAGLDCGVAKEEKDFDSVDRFFNGYRRWVFRNPCEPKMECLIIDLNKSCINLPVSEECATDDWEVSDSLPNQPNVITRRARKSVYQPKPQITPQDLEKPSSDSLSELRFAALDGGVPSEEREFNSVNRFFNAFRRSVFNNPCEPKVQIKCENGEKTKFDGLSQTLNGEKVLKSDSNKGVTPKKRKSKEEKSTGKNDKPTPTAGVFDVNGTSGSSVINFEMPGSSGPQNISKPKRERTKKLVETMQGGIEVVLPDLNSNCSIQSPFGVNSEPYNVSAPANNQVPRNLNVDSVENGSFVKIVQVNAEELDGKERVINALSDDQINNNGNKLKRSLLAKDAWLDGFLSPGNNNSEGKKRKRKEKTPKTESQSAATPDLNKNGSVAEKAKVLPNMCSAPSEGKKKIIGNKVSSPGAVLKSPCLPKEITKKDSFGTALVLTFAQGFPVPSKEALVATFRGFGSIKETETKSLGYNRSAQVVFEKGSDAVEALKGIEKSSPFGPFLVNCRVHHILPVTELKASEFKGVRGPKEAPNLVYIKKNLEMMTSVMEKRGETLPGEMREKLESEIKELMKKVNTMVGSSSSSSSS